MINMGGLSECKFSFVADLLVKFKLDFCFLQETMISDDVICHSSRDGRVLPFGPWPCSNNGSVWQKASDGCVLSVLVALDGFKLNLTSMHQLIRLKERRFFSLCIHFSFQTPSLS